ncbi:MAG: ATP-binding protein [Candidatus Thalassarchaeaceae archaeon]|jgi:DNA-binding PadR family transcriptional regulator|nr:ATP-binding protein [Candidatus Thalassarchaeaceae archaeon]MDP6844615.1 ATP-binding protein [Candidatus Thalassarchaeaceae archaeon]
MPSNDLRIHIAVEDRLLLHLLEQDEQADLYMVSAAVTRPGIAEACALHPPNVSRSMRTMLRNQWVSEHTRTVRGESRRQKTWQLTEMGRTEAKSRSNTLGITQVLIRDDNGQLLEVSANQASVRLAADLTLLQVLMHAQHEGVLTFGDIRFGMIQHREDGGKPAPGRLKLGAGAHATYHTEPPETREVHGRSVELDALDEWIDSQQSCMLVHGIAGIGKSTLAAHWIRQRMEVDEQLSICWYPCQPWDTALGLATSLLHRVGIDAAHDPVQLMETLPLTPGAKLDIDAYRRLLLSYLTDPSVLRERFSEDEAAGPPPYFLLVLDDVHHISEDAADLLGALLQVADSSPLTLLLISRTTLTFYDRRDVHTRERVSELALSGLSVEDLDAWISELEEGDLPAAPVVHEVTGGHPLAIELMEMYGEVAHGDWLRFLDEEILDVLPDDERELLATLAVSDRPVPWDVLAAACKHDGNPPHVLLERGLLLELNDGMWLHEALRERLLREVGAPQDERRKKLDTARAE